MFQEYVYSLLNRQEHIFTVDVDKDFVAAMAIKNRASMTSLTLLSGGYTVELTQKFAKFTHSEYDLFYIKALDSTHTQF